MHQTPCLELVQFRLAEGTTPQRFLALVRATETALRLQPGFVQRLTSRGDDGIWTDSVLWADAASAMAATKAVMAETDFAPFMAAIDPASVVMRHESVESRMA